MDQQQIVQQLNYAKLMFKMWLHDGPSVWNISNFVPNDIMVDLETSKVSVHELAEHCIQWKREGNYATAIAAYTRLFDTCYKKTKKLPIVTMSGFIKVLIAANQFYAAYELCSTAFADLQQRRDADPQEVQFFGGYWNDLCALSQLIIDRHDTSQLYNWCKNYAGSQTYTMVKTDAEIYSEFKQIRDSYRQIYGK